MKQLSHESGSILMEFVLVAPLLLMLIFSIIQLSYIFWARQLTFYAAYSAARTALVYNIKDYTDSTYDDDSSNDFKPSSGPLYLAAATIMSWMNYGDGSKLFPYFPKSDADVWWQVRISGKERVVAEGPDSIPVVAVTVHYYCPMLIPLVGDMLAYAMAGNLDDDGLVPQKNDKWEIFGWVPGDDYKQAMQSVTPVEDRPQKIIYSYNNIPVMHLQETCYMAKPYRTSTYARIPAGDLNYLRELK